LEGNSHPNLLSRHAPNKHTQKSFFLKKIEFLNGKIVGKTRISREGKQLERSVFPNGKKVKNIRFSQEKKY